MNIALNNNISTQIQTVIQQREIEYLLHFSHTSNLNSVLKHGLISRELAEEMGIEPFISDPHRLDGHLNAISTSITFPNYKMFYPKRKKLGGDWFVALIKPDVLWEKSCSFYSTNAANLNMQQLQNNNQVQDLQAMFYDSSINQSQERLRNHLSLSNNETTDPQAEVLIKGHIKLDNITDLIFDSRRYTNEANAYFTQHGINITAHYHPDFYYPRHDYRFWQ